jgi:hypothetical protein
MNMSTGKPVWCCARFQGISRHRPAHSVRYLHVRRGVLVWDLLSRRKRHF